jgi:hypothetical protein
MLEALDECRGLSMIAEVPVPGDVAASRDGIEAVRVRGIPDVRMRHSLGAHGARIEAFLICRAAA